MEGVRCVMIDSKCVIVQFINQCSNGVYLSLQGSDAARLKFWSCHKIVLSGERSFFFNQTGSKIARGRQSVSERRGRREVRCAGTVEHQGLIDVAKSVDFMIGTLKSCFQLIFNSL